MNSSLLEDLIKRSQEGDTVAMEAIYERYKQPIFNLIYRYTYNVTVAEDLLQDIFLKIFTHLKDVQKVESFVGWLYRIAINTCYSYLRSIKGGLQKTIPLEDVERKIDNDASDTPDSVLKKPLDDAIQHLPPKLKSVFLLHEVQGYKHGEIARMLGCTVGTSKSQLFKARMKLRQFLKNKQLV
jgi:RNA polymerase sigma-70 factor (ECF subfamily)